jgi:hypothetical protein
MAKAVSLKILLNLFPGLTSTSFVVMRKYWFHKTFSVKKHACPPSRAQTRDALIERHFNQEAIFFRLKKDSKTNCLKFIIEHKK